MTRAVSLLKAAVRGVWRFVVGDSPEFLVAVVALVGFALILHGVRQVVWVGLPMLVLGVLGVSVWHQARRHRTTEVRDR